VVDVEGKAATPGTLAPLVDGEGTNIYIDEKAAKIREIKAATRAWSIGSAERDPEKAPFLL
jgi:hypothetical protein